VRSAPSLGPPWHRHVLLTLTHTRTAPTMKETGREQLTNFDRSR